MIQDQYVNSDIVMCSQIHDEGSLDDSAYVRDNIRKNSSC